MENGNHCQNAVKRQPAGSQPLEDRALKAAAQFMGEELLPFLGIEGTMKRIAPTEQVYLEMKDLQEDFNYEMEDGTWKHLEFESDEITKEDLRRFRVYDAMISYHYKVEVTTCVICSSRVKRIRQELEEGPSRYCVQVIRMKDYDADRLIGEMEEKQASVQLERNDLMRLLLTPLMAGSMSQAERIVRSLRLIKYERGYLGTEDMARMQAVLYTLAMKFLTEEELRNVKEEIKMSLLGEMIRQDGVEEGIAIGMERGRELGVEQGIEQGICALVSTCRELNVSREEIVARLMKSFHLGKEQAEASYKKYAV